MSVAAAMKPFYEFVGRCRTFDGSGIFYVEHYVWRDVFSGDEQWRMVPTFWQPIKPLPKYIVDRYALQTTQVWVTRPTT